MAVGIKFIDLVSSVGKQFFNDMMAEIEKGLEETLPVLTAFYILNPDNLVKSVLTRKSYINTLINHYENPLADTHENDTVTADRIIDKMKDKKLK